MDAFELLARWGRPRTPAVGLRTADGSLPSRTDAGPRHDTDGAETSDCDEAARVTAEGRQR